MIMVRNRRGVDVQSRRIGAVGLSLTAVLFGLSLVVFSLRKTRVKLELHRRE